ncbi:hypothetical protein AVEN_118583-1 [Araneus ventricosus]|uniref:Uncharacterized protein n=1 Tax=Araneus ventricosus TaxID=182803 RepID=A0A4Y2AWR3_ARAVE|nr:hypothetical protein AVEN_118583-1 [Araneus ventricosus]
MVFEGVTEEDNPFRLRFRTEVRDEMENDDEEDDDDTDTSQSQHPFIDFNQGWRQWEIFLPRSRNGIHRDGESVLKFNSTGRSTSSFLKNCQSVDVNPPEMPISVQLIS